MRIEACWCITNIATGTNAQVQSLVEKGVIPLYVNILLEDDIHMIEQAIWGVGNISGDCIDFRDLMLQAGAMRATVKLYNKIKYKVKRNFVQQVLWAGSNLCRLKPAPDLHKIAVSVGMFAEGLKLGYAKHVSDGGEEQTMIDCSWALSQITCPQTVRAVVEQDIVPTLINLLDVKPMVLLHPVLRIIGAISNAEESICQMIIDHGIEEKLSRLLSHESKHVRKEACWIISNITAGNST